MAWDCVWCGYEFIRRISDAGISTHVALFSLNPEVPVGCLKVPSNAAEMYRPIKEDEECIFLDYTAYELNGTVNSK